MLKSQPFLLLFQIGDWLDCGSDVGLSRITSRALGAQFQVIEISLLAACSSIQFYLLHARFSTVSLALSV